MATTAQTRHVSNQATEPRRKHTREEMLAIFRAAREEVQAANPEGRDLLAELLAERRAEAASE
jgi:cytochrome P450